VASTLALAMTAAPGTTGGSPTPHATRGPSGEGASTITGVIGGTFSAEGSA
jgi:hypothetical protein